MAARKTVAAPAATKKTRQRVVARPNGEEHGGDADVSYFAQGNQKEGIEFVSSGCCVLDEALGGAYALGRVANFIGDRSVGKTLNAMEVAANFHMLYPNGRSRYAESEAAFDMRYAEALGMPVDLIEFNTDGQPMRTIEILYDDMERFMDAHPGVPKLYIVDSLDALSDDKELEEDFGEDSFGGKKPKLIGQLFRRLIDRFEKERMLVVIVSQIRENMNAGPFSEKYKRSGGKALDFYATHIVWFTEKGKLKRSIDKVERVVGVQVLARVRKNKIGLAYREVEYPILYGYGIDDLTSAAEWLVKNNRADMLAEAGLSKGYAVLLNKLRDRGGDEVRELRKQLTAIVRREWQKIEVSFLPKSSKY